MKVWPFSPTNERRARIRPSKTRSARRTIPSMSIRTVVPACAAGGVPMHTASAASTSVRLRCMGNLGLRFQNGRPGEGQRTGASSDPRRRGLEVKMGRLQDREGPCGSDGKGPRGCACGAHRPRPERGSCCAAERLFALGRRLETGTRSPRRLPHLVDVAERLELRHAFLRPGRLDQRGIAPRREPIRVIVRGDAG